MGRTAKERERDLVRFRRFAKTIEEAARAVVRRNAEQGLRDVGSVQVSDAEKLLSSLAQEKDRLGLAARQLLAEGLASDLAPGDFDQLVAVRAERIGRRLAGAWVDVLGDIVVQQPILLHADLLPPVTPEPLLEQWKGAAPWQENWDDLVRSEGLSLGDGVEIMMDFRTKLQALAELIARHTAGVMDDFIPNLDLSDVIGRDPARTLDLPLSTTLVATAFADGPALVWALPASTEARRFAQSDPIGSLVFVRVKIPRGEEQGWETLPRLRSILSDFATNNKGIRQAAVVGQVQDVHRELFCTCEVLNDRDGQSKLLLERCVKEFPDACIFEPPERPVAVSEPSTPLPEQVR